MNYEAVQLVTLTIKDCERNINHATFEPLLEDLYRHVCHYLEARKEALGESPVRDSSVQIHLERNAVDIWKRVDTALNRLRLKGVAFVALPPDEFAEAYKIAREWSAEKRQDASA